MTPTPAEIHRSLALLDQTEVQAFNVALRGRIVTRGVTVSAEVPGDILATAEQLLGAASTAGVDLAGLLPSRLIPAATSTSPTSAATPPRPAAPAARGTTSPAAATATPPATGNHVRSDPGPGLEERIRASGDPRAAVLDVETIAGVEAAGATTRTLGRTCFASFPVGSAVKGSPRATVAPQVAPSPAPGTGTLAEEYQAIVDPTQKAIFRAEHFDALRALAVAG